MKIALPICENSMDAEIHDSFGRASYYLIYNTITKDSEYLDHRAVADQGGSGIRAAQVLADHGVRAIITPKCGENAEKTLRYCEVLVYQSIAGSILQNIEAFVKDRLNLMNEFRPRRKE